ncbi:endonuclease domain-containing protein [Acinetobacter ursingii]|uniref:endonuclease domain-containing protein n=1 Tax=Acinetobacter ursingii TaxID=108980 RepID=UPI00124FD431|nr:DUF559 domain-containing protein [Acinetobacter ursingii]MCH2015049.1 DUF559 domain-containing protein [Acinetobacter ursingii]
MPQINSELLEFARNMRKNPTEAEHFMWQILRARKFAGFKFRRQHVIEPYIVDFYCHELKLDIELDGSQHNQTQIKAYDQKRTNHLEAQNIRVLRFWNNEILQQPEQVLNRLWHVVHERASQQNRESHENLHPAS